MPDAPARRHFHHHAAEVIDGFRLMEPLGSGGNGEVWRAEHAEHGVVALKLLSAKRPMTERFRRFRREVEVQGEVSAHGGVLPVIATYVPDDGGQAWLATPEATPFDSPEAASEVPVLVDRVAEIAETLAWLHEQSYAHRDIKPGNLFVYDGHAVLGDFGLVDDPGGEEITGAVGVLGPRHYVAWEVLDNPDADWRRADVYALGKSLWVILTAQRYPQPGQHRPDELIAQVATYTPHPWAAQLDQILAAATHLDPVSRISASELAMSLRALQTEPPSVELADVDDLALRRLSEHLRPAQSEAARRNSYIVHLRNVLLPRVDEILWPMELRIREVAPYGTETGAHLHENALLGWRTNTEESGRQDVLDLHRLGYWAFTDDPAHRWSLTGGVGAELLADGTLRLLGIHMVLRTMATGVIRVLEIREEVPILSPRSEQVCVSIAETLTAKVEAALTAWSRALDDES